MVNLRKKAKILAISTGSVYSHKVWIEASPMISKVKFPLVDYMKKEISSAYGSLNTSSGMTKGVQQ